MLIMRREKKGKEERLFRGERERETASSRRRVFWIDIKETFAEHVQGLQPVYLSSTDLAARGRWTDSKNQTFDPVNHK